MTVEEFLTLPDIEEQRVELFDGEVVDMPSGGRAHEIAKSNLIEILAPWLKQHRVGKIFVESACRMDEQTVVVPDLSLLSNERFSQWSDGLFPGAPDLAIEVVSSETANRLQTKIRLYLKHGSKAVWSIFLEARTVQIDFPSGHGIVIEQDGLLEGQDALPGFSTPVSAIFEGL